MNKEKIKQIYNKHKIQLTTGVPHPLHGVTDLEINKFAEEISNSDGAVVSLPIEVFDVEEFLNTKNIYDHPQIQDSVTGSNSYEVARLIAEFANKIISKMKSN